MIDPISGEYRPGMALFDGDSLANSWMKVVGTDDNGQSIYVETNQTLPTLNELRHHVEATNRAPLTWEDVLNYRNRDANGDRERRLRAGY